MNARLFCGDPDRKQHFSELIDVATVQAERWQDTRVYGLFKNEWWASIIAILCTLFKILFFPASLQPLLSFVQVVTDCLSACSLLFLSAGA